VIAGGSVVSNSFPPYQIIGGNPARIVRDRRKQSPAPNESLAVRKLLFSEDPYMNPTHVYPEDLQGWGFIRAYFPDPHRTPKAAAYRRSRLMEGSISDTHGWPVQAPRAADRDSLR
jgi:hypothetical protein